MTATLHARRGGGPRLARSPTRSPRCCTAPPTRNSAWPTGRTTASRWTRRRSPGFLGGLDASWAGLSLTMPLKRAVIPLLDEVSETAASVEAVNTVVFTEDGRRLGDNTDIPGMVAALRERGVEQGRLAPPCSAPEPPPPPRSPRSPGSAPARSPPTCAARRGPPRCAAGASGSASTCAPPTGRTRDRGAARAAGHRHHPGRRHGRARRGGARRAPARSSTCCTSPGRRRWPPPGRRTGGAVVGGLDLLVHQAVLQVEQMTGRAPGPAGGDARGGRAGARRDRVNGTARRSVRSGAGRIAVRLLDRRPGPRPGHGRIGAAGQGRAPGRASRSVRGASMRSTVEQVALADRGGVARPRTGGDAGGASRRRAGHHGDGGGRTWPGGGSATGAARG